jgi:hypothetical protein
MKGAYRKITKKPATIESIPQSTELGDVDAVVTPLESEADSPTASGANTPVGDGPSNRKMRRAELKQKKKKQ